MLTHIGSFQLREKLSNGDDVKNPSQNQKKEKLSECPKTAATKTNPKKNMQHAAEGEGR
jgi:hypothetical protein